MNTQYPYSRCLEWILNSPKKELITSNSAPKLLALCQRFDQLSGIEGHQTALGLERHNHADGRIDCFVRGRKELFQLQGVSYPRWTDEILSYLRENKLETYFPGYYHLEFDEDGLTHRLAGIFQNCWPLVKAVNQDSLERLALYLETTTLFNKELVVRSKALGEFIDTFGFPCSFGIMDRHKNFLKVAAQIDSPPQNLKDFLTKNFTEIYNGKSGNVENLICALDAYLKDGVLWVNLDINLDHDSFLKRICFEMISPGKKPRKNFDSIYSCLNRFEIKKETIAEVKLATNQLPFGYKRNNIADPAATETLSGWLNHVKLCIEESGISCKTYIGIQYSNSKSVEQ